MIHEGLPHKRICEAAGQFDLIIMGKSKLSLSGIYFRDELLITSWIYRLSGVDDWRAKPGDVLKTNQTRV